MKLSERYQYLRDVEQGHSAEGTEEEQEIEVSPELAVPEDKKNLFQEGML